MFGIIRIGHQVAAVAINAIGISDCKPGAISWRGTAFQPTGGAVAPEAQVAGTIKILLGYGHGGPENRVAAGIAHGGPGPTGYRLILRFTFTGGCRCFIVIADVAIVTFGG